MRIECTGMQGPTGDEAVEAILSGFSESAAALCLCDADDLIQHANATFRNAFFPQFDGRPAEFMDTMAAAMRAGTGIRLVSANLEDFTCAIRKVRRRLVGSRSFATDFVDGRWWSVTDTKLSNGWILAVAQDISALKNEEAKLRDAHATAVEEAQTDYLTGVPNRRHGLRRAEALFRRAQAEGLGLSLALIDVDHFKTINDVYGHEAGDRALVHLARHLMEAIPGGDQFSRLGGDEFLLVRADADAGSLGTALAAFLDALPPVAFAGASGRLRLSISAGVARSMPDDTWPGLMHRADIALYDAKAGGRDRIALAV